MVYWAPNRAFRCTNAVADGATRLTAPPRASNAMPPVPPFAPATGCRFSMPRSSVLIPAPLSGLVKKSDLAYCGWRFSRPPGTCHGRWQAW